LLANDKYDIWLGDVRIQAAGTPTQPDKLLTSFTLMIKNTGSNITYSFDNFIVETIPEPATIGLVGFSSGFLMLFRRRRQFRK
jgi:hypothetical protein